MAIPQHQQHNLNLTLEVTDWPESRLLTPQEKILQQDRTPRYIPAPPSQSQHVSRRICTCPNHPHIQHDRQKDLRVLRPPNGNTNGSCIRECKQTDEGLRLELVGCEQLQEATEEHQSLRLNSVTGLQQLPIDSVGYLVPVDEQQMDVEDWLQYHISQPTDQSSKQGQAIGEDKATVLEAK